MKSVIQIIKSKFNWFSFKTSSNTKISSGTISYDYWNEIHPNFDRKLKVCKHNSEKDGMDYFGDVDQFIARISEDTRNSDSPEKTVYFDQKKVRIIYDIEPQKDYFGWYNVKDLSTISYSLKDGKWTKSNGSMNFRSNPEWHVKYKIEDLKEEKIIKGYRCKKMQVTQLKTISKNLDILIYEIYVTDKIKLPSHVICGWFDFVLNECPLELKIYNPKNPEIINYFKVRNISNDLPKSIFDLPKEIEI